MPCPSAFSTARMREVNSCPPGIARKEIPVATPSRRMLRRRVSAGRIGEVITRRSEVLGELAEFLALGTASVIDEEGILMLEASEEPLELGEDVLI